MNKRTKRQIENDVTAIKEATKTATTLKEIAMLTGLTTRKVTTSLANHPIIKKRVLALLKANTVSKVASIPTTLVEEKTATENLSKDSEGCIVICDCPALMYGISNCLATPIVIPQFVKNSLIGISKNKSPEATIAKDVLVKLNTFLDWCTVVPKIKEELLTEPSFEISWRTKALVALACKYWSEGYEVTIKTRTAEVAKVATLQECLTVDFVIADDKAQLKIVS